MKSRGLFVASLCAVVLMPGPWAATLAQTADSNEPATRLMEGPAPDAAEDNKAPIVRMMLKVQIPIQSGNRAIENGTMGTIFESLMQKIKPEAAYFSQEGGLRTAYFVYVMDGTFEFAEIHEPLIQGLGARVYDQPALTWEDIGKAFADTQEKK
ncbi:MAG: hypothetical protein GY789_07150 [Hyphomicrobiales bacterium]|nr:hypothetical protein [Hyphomicrobiales bacterium]MCP4997351.1 hypothetical protein [Hyphomicrobiales bacterium]